MVAHLHEDFRPEAARGRERCDRRFEPGVLRKLSVCGETLERFRILSEIDAGVGAGPGGTGRFGLPVVGDGLRGRKEGAVQFSRLSKALFDEGRGAAAFHQVPGFVDQDELRRTPVLLHFRLDREHDLQQHRVSKRRMPREPFHFKDREVARKVEGAPRAVRPLRQGTAFGVGGELLRGVEKALVGRAVRLSHPPHHGDELGERRRAALRPRFAVEDRKREEKPLMEERVALAVAQKLFENRRHALDAFGLVREISERICIPHVFVVEGEKVAAQKPAELFVASAHVDHPDAPALGENAQGKLVHDDGLPGAGFSDDRPREAPRSAGEGVDVKEVPSAREKRKKRRLRLFVVAPSGPRIVGDDGQQRRDRFRGAPRKAVERAGVLRKQRSRRQGKRREERLYVQCGVGAQLDPVFARERSCGFDTERRLPHGREKQDFRLRRVDGKPPREAFRGDREVLRAVVVVGRQGRDGRAAHLPRTDEFRLDLGFLQDAVRHLPPGGRQEGTGNLRARAPRVARERRRRGERPGGRHARNRKSHGPYGVLEPGVVRVRKEDSVLFDPDFRVGRDRLQAQFIQRIEALFHEGPAADFLRIQKRGERRKQIRCVGVAVGEVGLFERHAHRLARRTGSVARFFREGIADRKHDRNPAAKAPAKDRRLRTDLLAGGSAKERRALLRHDPEDFADGGVEPLRLRQSALFKEREGVFDVGVRKKRHGDGGADR